MADKENTIPIKDLLYAFDHNDVDFYKSLTPEMQKKFSPWLAMRYASSSQKDPEYHILMVNDLINKYFSTLSSHPELLWRTFAMCGTGKTQFHKWIVPPKSKKKNKKQTIVSEMYPSMKLDDIEVFISLNTDDELKDLAKQYGYTDDEIKEAFE